MTDQLQALGRTIRSVVALQGFYHLRHPAQIKHLKTLGKRQLEEFAREYGARVVVRAHGDFYDFTRIAL